MSCKTRKIVTVSQTFARHITEQFGYLEDEKFYFQCLDKISPNDLKYSLTYTVSFGVILVTDEK